MLVVVGCVGCEGVCWLWWGVLVVVWCSAVCWWSVLVVVWCAGCGVVWCLVFWWGLLVGCVGGVCWLSMLVVCCV